MISRKHYVSVGTCVVLALIIGCGGSSGGGSGTTTSTTAGAHQTGAKLPTATQVKNEQRGLTFGASTPPSSADLTTTGFLPPVMNQDPLESCVACAIGYGLCTYETALAGGPAPSSPSAQASALDLYSHLLQIEGQGCPGEGTQPSDAFGWLSQYGVQSNAAVPYTGQCTSPGNPGGSFGLSGSKSLMVSNGTAPDDEGIKLSLSQGHPVAVAIEVPSDLIAWGGTQGNQTSTYSLGSNNFIGGHELLVVGYNDAQSAYNIQNSWGTSWGNNGRFLMSYSTFDQIVVDAGVSSAANIPPVNGGSAVTMQILAQQYFYEGYYILYVPFQLSQPLYVQSFTLSGPPGSASIAVDQWAYQSYVWFYNTVPYPAGTYTLSFNGLTRANVSASPSAQASLQNEFVQRPIRAPKGATELLRQLNPTPAKAGETAVFRPGSKMVVNGIAYVMDSNSKLSPFEVGPTSGTPPTGAPQASKGAAKRLR